jgi:hypothetical protein
VVAKRQNRELRSLNALDLADSLPRVLVALAALEVAEDALDVQPRRRGRLGTRVLQISQLMRWRAMAESHSRWLNRKGETTAETGDRAWLE